MLRIEPELVTRAPEGDESASRTIIERLHRPVLATIYRFLGSRFRDQVEDAAQEAGDRERTTVPDVIASTAHLGR